MASEAYKNAQKLREVVRGIYRACSLDPAYAQSNGPEQAAKRLARARQLTDLQLAAIGGHSRKLVEEAIKAERIASAQGTATSHLHVMVQQAYELMQVLPSWEGLPEGGTENKLRAVEALLKTSKPEAAPTLTLNAISLIVGVKKPEPVSLPKPKPKPSQPTAPVLEETGKPKSPHHQEPVVKDEHSSMVWGYHAPYYMIKKGTPMTWGAQLVWVDKGFKKPGKPGDKYYVHPGYATPAIKAYHDGVSIPVPATVEETEALIPKEIAPLLATETHLPDEGSEDVGDDEA